MLFFADDTVIKTISSLNSLDADHQKFPRESNVCLASNKLTFNSEKNKEPRFLRKNQLLNTLQIQQLMAKKGKNCKI